MLFNFILRPTAEITPWGAPEKPSLSWFGLSDGWYWLAVNGQEIFRARDVEPGVPPYADYQVVRPWEDILDVLPLAITPIPPEAAALIGTDPLAWARTVEQMIEDADDEDLDKVIDETNWWRSRRLDTGHLRYSPRIWFWRIGDDVHIAWRTNREGGEIWIPTNGWTRMTVDAFLAEVHDFDARFMRGMEEHVHRLRRDNGRPGVHIDLAQLEREHADRKLWLARALDGAPSPA